MVWSGYLVGRGPRVLLHHGLVVDVTVFELLVDSELILGGARVPGRRGIPFASVFLRDGSNSLFTFPSRGKCPGKCRRARSPHTSCGVRGTSSACPWPRARRTDPAFKGFQVGRPRLMKFKRRKRNLVGVRGSPHYLQQLSLVHRLRHGLLRLRSGR